MWCCASKSMRSEYGLLLSSRQTLKGWGLSCRKHHLLGSFLVDFSFSGGLRLAMSVLAVDMPCRVFRELVDLAGQLSRQRFSDLLVFSIVR